MTINLKIQRTNNNLSNKIKHLQNKTQQKTRKKTPSKHENQPQTNNFKNARHLLNKTWKYTLQSANKNENLPQQTQTNHETQTQQKHEHKPKQTQKSSKFVETHMKIYLTKHNK